MDSITKRAVAQVKSSSKDECSQDTVNKEGEIHYNKNSARRNKELNGSSTKAGAGLGG